MVKQSAQRAGIEIDLKLVTPNACFPSDAGNPDTFGRFQADMQMYNWTRAIPDLEAPMQPFVSWEVASKADQQMGKNSVRWQNAEFDALFRAAQTEADLVKRAAQFIRVNDLLVGDDPVIPVIVRNSARAVGRGIATVSSGWHVTTANLHDWPRESKVNRQLRHAN